MDGLHQGVLQGEGDLSSEGVVSQVRCGDTGPEEPSERRSRLPEGHDQVVRLRRVADRGPEEQ